MKSAIDVLSFSGGRIEATSKKGKQFQKRREISGKAQVKGGKHEKSIKRKSTTPI